MWSRAVKIIRKRCGYEVYCVGTEKERSVNKYSYSVPHDLDLNLHTNEHARMFIRISKRTSTKIYLLYFIKN